jgi:hypothetical protein
MKKSIIELAKNEINNVSGSGMLREVAIAVAVVAFPCLVMIGGIFLRITEPEEVICVLSIKNKY